MIRKKINRSRINDIYIMIGVSLLAVMGYTLWVSNFTIPVHIKVDEELYISMARSFHYEGVFSENGIRLNYSCILYSMLISLAYYFCTPENIIFGMRVIGVCTMLSSVFPIYLIARKILKRKKYAVAISVLFCFIPSVIDVAYCMQEVLCYPVFLWMFYFIYKEIEQEKTDKISKHAIIITVLGILCYFIKTYMLFAIVAYEAFIILEGYRNRNREIWKKILLLTILYISLYMGGKTLIDCINGGVAGENHYASQFSQLFPITVKTIAAACSCMVFYGVSWVFYMGVLPVILPIYNLRKYERSNQKIISFLILCTVILIVEIVISIVLTEEGTVFFPHKFLYRYFQILEMPILILFVQKISRFKLPGWLWLAYSGILGYLGGYFIYIGNKQRTAIIDAPVFLLMENITKYIFPGFNILICVLVAGIICAGYYILRKNGEEDVLKKFICIYILGITVFFMIDMVQLPYYTNRIANGNLLQKESLEIVDYYMGHKERYHKIYYIQNKSDRYESTIYAYFPSEILKISEDDLQNRADADGLYIMSVNTDIEIDQIGELQELKAYRIGTMRQKR